jgi:hypothetical protein
LVAALLFIVLVRERHADKVALPPISASATVD